MLSSGLAGVAIQAALGQLGVPYRYAQASPGVAFDCSGLTYYAWAQAGVSLPRNSRMQAAAIPRVPIAAAQPGDLLFYYSPISHVGIYLGNECVRHPVIQKRAQQKPPRPWQAHQDFVAGGF